jgi:hypothetical protein
MNVSSGDMKKAMEPGIVWFKKGGKEIVDARTPLTNGMNFAKKGDAKTKTKVAGYSIVQAENMDVVKAIIADSPQFILPQASIEVFEMMPM